MITADEVRNKYYVRNISMLFLCYLTYYLFRHMAALRSVIFIEENAHVYSVIDFQTYKLL